MDGRRRETEHGTLSCGKYRKCQRPECVEAVRAYRRRVYRLKGYGQWQPLVDAAPAQDHIGLLNAQGCSFRSIAEALGLGLSAVTKVMYTGPRRKAPRRIRPEFSEAILSLTLEDVNPPLVSAVGVSRRIRALNLMGWPNTVIGERVGSWNTQMNHIHQQKTVTRSMALAVSDCYESLKRMDPSELGVRREVALCVASKARKHGARDPLWWEDWGTIDDPRFDPADAERALSRDELAAHRRHEIAYLMSDGCIPERIAQRLEMHVSTVREVMLELETGVRRVRKQVA